MLRPGPPKSLDAGRLTNWPTLATEGERDWRDQVAGATPMAASGFAAPFTTAGGTIGAGSPVGVGAPEGSAAVCCTISAGASSVGGVAEVTITSLEVSTGGAPAGA